MNTNSKSTNSHFRQKALSVVIVSFNGKDDLLVCLDSLTRVRNESDFEVIVVDNGSTDGSIPAVRDCHSWVQVIEAGRNLGFAAACNRGLQAAQGRHRMLLNPDTEVLPGSLEKLITALNQSPNWGIVGPMMVDQSDRPYRSARRFPTPFFLFCECTRLIYLFPRTRLFGDYFYGNCDINSITEVDQIEGSALIIGEAAYQAVGPLDERFFIFFEEVDWCRRVRDAGFEIRVIPDSTIRHHRSTSMSKFYVESRKANARSALKYFEKYHGIRGVQSLRHWMRTALCIRMLMANIISLFGNRELAKLRYLGAKAENRIYRQWPESCN